MESDSSWQRWGRPVLFWVLCGAAGGMLAYPLFIFITAGAYGQGFNQILPAILIGAFLTGLIVGAVFGFLQWLVIRKDFPQANGWPLTSMVAWAVGISLSVGLFLWLIPDGINVMTYLVPLMIGGAVAGYIESWILRRWVSGTSWWILAMASSWVLGPVLAFVFLGQLAFQQAPSSGVLLVILGAIHGGVVGFQLGFTYQLLKGYYPLLPEDPAEFVAGSDSSAPDTS